jgi:hypothetical protein
MTEPILPPPPGRTGSHPALSMDSGTGEPTGPSVSAGVRLCQRHSHEARTGWRCCDDFDAFVPWGTGLPGRRGKEGVVRLRGLPPGGDGPVCRVGTLALSRTSSGIPTKHRLVRTAR